MVDRKLGMPNSRIRKSGISIILIVEVMDLPTLWILKLQISLISGLDVEFCLICGSVS